MAITARQMLSAGAATAVMPPWRNRLALRYRVSEVPGSSPGRILSQRHQENTPQAAANADVKLHLPGCSTLQSPADVFSVV